MGSSQEITTKHIFPIFAYDGRTSVIKSISKGRYQGLTTGMFLTIWSHSFMLLCPESTLPYFTVLATVFQKFTCLYEFFLIYKTLTFTDKLFEDMEIGDVIECMKSAIGTLEDSEGYLRTNNCSLQELSELLKLFLNATQWEKVRLQQRKELSLPFGVSFKKEDFDVADKTEQELLRAINKLELVSGEKVEQGEKLRNYESITQIANKKSLNLKALTAAFTSRLSVLNLINEKKALMEQRREKVKAENQITFFKREGYSVEDHSAPNVILRNTIHQLMDNKPEDIPDNVQYDPTSFFDRSFAKGEFNDCCTWIRAKDLPPKDKELALFSDNCEEDVQ